MEFFGVKNLKDKQDILQPLMEKYVYPTIIQHYRDHDEVFIKLEFYLDSIKRDFKYLYQKLNNIESLSEELFSFGLKLFEINFYDESSSFPISLAFVCGVPRCTHYIEFGINRDCRIEAIVKHDREFNWEI